MLKKTFRREKGLEEKRNFKEREAEFKKMKKKKEKEEKGA